MNDASPDRELLDAIRLNLVPGVGPRMRQALLDRFGDAGRVLKAKREELRKVPGIGPKIAKALLEHDGAAEAQREFTRCREMGITLVRRGDAAYPASLDEIPDPPTLLYVRGRITEADRLAVAIVGSRRCTPYGLRHAERFAQVLARAGVTIVSGLARGIDAAAHRGALAVGGRTIAVTATGHAEVYPPEHASLADAIAESGAVVTEMPLDQAPTPGLFPQRNRIISGLSLGVLLIEASKKSGSLHTARHAMEQNREVMALPGSVDSFANEGCHDLLRDGATLIRHPDDVFEALGPLERPTPTESGGEVLSPRELSLNDQERTVLNLVGVEPRPIDEVLRGAPLDPARVLSTLTILEMKRMVRRLPGSQIVRVPS
jgi:DNA processing protein